MPDQVPHALVQESWVLLKLAPPISFLYVAIQQLGSSYPLSLLIDKQSNVVDLWQGVEYIGETKRSLGTRLKEH